MILTLAAMKGGVGKTTSAAFLAHVLVERGHRVICLDSDWQESLTEWARLGSWTLPVETWTPEHDPDRPRRLAEDGWTVLIDTPPADTPRGRITAAVRVSTHVLLPIMPSPLEVLRAWPLGELIEDVRPDGRLVTAALLVRTVHGASSTGAYRAALTEAGWRVLRTTVGRLERYAQALAGPIVNAGATAYGDALVELSPSPTPIREVHA